MEMLKLLFPSPLLFPHPFLDLCSYLQTYQQHKMAFFTSVSTISNITIRKNKRKIYQCPQTMGKKYIYQKTSFDEYNFFIKKPQTTKSVNLSSINCLFFPWGEYALHLELKMVCLGLLLALFLFFFFPS